jgi:hypothetical protein
MCIDNGCRSGLLPNSHCIGRLFSSLSTSVALVPSFANFTKFLAWVRKFITRLPPILSYRRNLSFLNLSGAGAGLTPGICHLSLDAAKTS